MKSHRKVIEKMAEFLTELDKRSAYCAELTTEDLGKRVCVMGWVQKQRDLGALIFIDLRDRTGIVQLAFDDKTDKDIFDAAFGIRAEYTLCAKGIVRRRGEGAVNKNIPTGEIEIAVDELKILSVAQTPPFEIVENSNVNAELRLKYRYLDLRRPDMQRNIIARSKIGKIARDYYADNGFIDIETPTSASPPPREQETISFPAVYTAVSSMHFLSLPSSISSCLWFRDTTDISRLLVASETRTSELTVSPSLLRSIQRCPLLPQTTL